MFTPRAGPGVEGLGGTGMLTSWRDLEGGAGFDEELFGGDVEARLGGARMSAGERGAPLDLCRRPNSPRNVGNFPSLFGE